MAFTQTQANKKGASVAQFEDSAGNVGTRIAGGVTIYVGTVTAGDPAFSANLGDIVIDIANGAMYMNDSGAATWASFDQTT